MSGSRVDDGVIGNGDNRRCATRANLHICIHVGKQHAAGVCDFDAHPCGPRRFPHLRVDQRHLPLETAARQAAHPDGRHCAKSDDTEVELRHIGKHPDGRDVGNTEKHLTGRRLHAVDDIALQHNAVAWRVPGHRQRHLARPLDVGNYPR